MFGPKSKENLSLSAKVSPTYEKPAACQSRLLGFNRHQPEKLRPSDISSRLEKSTVEGVDVLECDSV